ncbi:MAG: ATP-binding cassette domain-containing protein, partial [Deltaproteobacteria bacterium]|nr:ATP-binding cassette domain-containing protein [Deltaproteobacteria bacterium]
MSLPILRAERICQSFGGLQALIGVDVDVPRGEIFAVIGPNGAGKTTLFNVISGVQRGFSGQVFYEGEVISGLPPHEISKRGVTRTFQNVRLFKSLTVAENVMVGCHGWVMPGFFRAIFRRGKTAEEERTCRQTA